MAPQYENDETIVIESRSALTVVYRVDFADGAVQFIVPPGGSFTAFGRVISISVMETLSMGVKSPPTKTSTVEPV